MSWGVKILHTDDIRYYMEQKKKKVFTQEIKNFCKRCREKSRNWLTKGKNK